MKTLLTILLLLPIFAQAQARLVFNNNAYINIENQAYLVVDNGAANAITLLGSGGNILSENENDVVKWNIGNNTGVHHVPFTNTNGIKVPAIVNVTTAGNATGNLIFSTYRTANNNTPYPSDVNNMCSSVGPMDASLFAVDRFWRIDPAAYTTRPAVSLSFGYDFVNEAAPANTITESNLQAQRFNPGAGAGNYCVGAPSVGSWQDLLFGTVNTVTKHVNNAVISPANFFKSWVLVDVSHPLPITLAGFNANCEQKIQVHWSTASEQNSDKFIIEKRNDDSDWEYVSEVVAAGNSHQLINYSYEDNRTWNGTTYYRLRLINFDGQQQVYGPISVSCDAVENSLQVYPSPNSGSFVVAIHSSFEIQNGAVQVYDLAGKVVYSVNVNALSGTTLVPITNLEVVPGAYFVKLLGGDEALQTPVKIIID